MKREMLHRAATQFPEGIMYPFNEMMGLSGFDAICEFTDMFGGRTVYVPSKRGVFLQSLEEQLKEDYNGYNMINLTRDYRLNQKQVKRLLGLH